MKLDRALGVISLASAVALIAAAGCRVEVEDLDDDGSGGAGGTSAANTNGSMVSSGTVQPQTTGTGTSTGTGGGVPADESTSCADAVALEAKMNNAGGTFYDSEGYLAEAKDSDYFKFEAKKGDWISLFTDANPMDIPDNIDTVLTLYNADGSKQLAEVDDAFPRQTTDSELIYHVVEDGTYCVRVWEFSEWNGDTAEGGPTFKYRVGYIPMDFSLYEQYNVDTEPNNTTGAAQTGLSYSATQSGQNFTTIAGTFADDADADVYEITTPVGAVGMSTTFTPSGTDGYGSTQGPGNIRVFDTDGNTILAYLDYQKGADGFSSIPVQAETKYYLQVTRPAGTVGSNDSYFLKFNTSDQLNPQETDNVANDSALGAEVAVGQQNPDNPKMNSFFIGGNIPATDTDWWKVSAKNGDTVVVACSSQRAGSGAKSVSFTMLKADGTTEIQTETETETKDVLWSTAPSASKAPISVTEDGDYMFRVKGSTQDANIAGNWYLCGIHVTSP